MFFLFSFSGGAQIKLDKTKYNFGDLEAYSARYVDFKLTNIGAKEEWVLRLVKPKEVIYISSKQIIEKDSSIIIRLQVTPKSKGHFNYKIDLFLSDRADAIELRLTGNLQEVIQDGSNNFTACPTFEDKPGGKNPNSFNLTVVTVDAESREELSQSTVTFIQNGRPVWVEETDSKGKVKEEGILGMSYFYATHKGYYPAEMGAYINFKRNYIIIELDKDPNNCPIDEVKIDTNIIANTYEEEVIIEIETYIEEELAPIIDTSIIAELPPLFADLESDNFDEQYFKPINVVFVLDVSSSMKQADKMELMKYSLFQLTDMLRPQDKIGIVTYSSNARVLLASTSGDEKEFIGEEIEALKAAGFTSGGAGIKLGFKIAKRAFIEDGENLVIIITDGAFNRSSDDYKKYIKKYNKKGIHFSVVGIKNKVKDEEEMREDAKLGSGNYISIQKLSDAQNNLNQEIRRFTYKLEY